MRRAPLELSDAFSLVIKNRREAKGLSRAALAEKSGLHQTYIGLLERGARSPTLDTAKTIADSLGVPLSHLVIEAEKLSRARFCHSISFIHVQSKQSWQKTSLHPQATHATKPLGSTNPECRP